MGNTEALEFWSMVSDWVWDMVEDEALTTPPSPYEVAPVECEPTVKVALPLLK